MVHRFRKRSATVRHAALSVSEALEKRTLLSGTPPQVLTSFGLFNTVGLNPVGNLVIDPAGNTFGMTNGGGMHGLGTIFELSSDHQSLTTLFSFSATDGEDPQAGLARDSGGDLFGTTSYGGSAGDGTLFELSANHQTLTTLVNFNSSTGINPYAAVTLDVSGDIFGTTLRGGTGNNGTIFELSANHQTFTTLVNMNSSSGGGIYSSVIFDASGNLFGNGFGGGSGGDGIVFELSANHQVFTTLASFNGSNGSNPIGGMVIDSAGNLYGTTSSGGQSYGTVFKISANHSTFNQLVTFSSGNGADPRGSLTIDKSDDIFGTTFSGGNYSNGTIFEITPNQQTTLNTLVNFSTIGSEEVTAGVTFDAGGDVLGTTNYGGAYNKGSLFQLSANRQTLTTLVNFNFSSGVSPVGGVIADSTKNLFGTTDGGGPGGYGTVFEISNSLSYTTLASFNMGNGAYPQGGLLLDSSGNLLGTTTSGGSFSGGTVFEVAANHQAMTTLVSFSSDSAGAVGTLVADSSGNVFGMTKAGGINELGTIFELPAGYKTFTTLVSFNSSTGSHPAAGLTMDANGDLFGTTSAGGAGGDGTVFELTSNHTTFKVLANFNGSNGAAPNASLAIDSAGDLFGTAQGGTYNHGTLFEILATTQGLTTLINFNTSNGASPQGGIVLDSAGDIFGSTYQGGTSGDGTLFELAPNHQLLTTLLNFNLLNGANPWSLTIDNADDLFGTTTYCGESDDGTVFELATAAMSNPALYIPVRQAIFIEPIAQQGPTDTAFSGVTIGAGGTLSIAPAATSASRQLLIINGIGLSVAGAIGAWTGALSLANNDLDLAGGSLATTTNQVQQAYANGTWTGTTGITSSFAASAPSHLTALGVIQNNQSGTVLYTATNTFDRWIPNPSDILVKYTYYGDTNLDGKVDGSDYSRIDNGSLNHLTGWFNGDFNYDGIVDGSDYTLIDNAYNTQGASLATQIAAMVASRTVARTASVFCQLPVGTPSDRSSYALITPPNNLESEMFGTDDIRRRDRRDILPTADD